MRRVVVTGLGIVSSIGTGQDEVSASLREGRSGVVAAPDHTKYGFRSQVWAPPSLGVTAEDWAPHVDRRAARFLANGTAWGHIAFEEALKDCGLTPEEIKSERIGVIVGEGGPSTQVILQAAAITVEKMSPKRIGPFAVP
ncbi:MAG: beta-ketoacyl synthase N-terminal-like domain-containing protein, partial [Brevundimonas sp.]|uniref:beta-ketoacyl synthase N-terminal-like domain-containing protein n=1 Tax=Brevundimonas sp. TaxID=1871086 RepID=UPI0027287941